MNKYLNILNPNLKVSVVALCIKSGARYVNTKLEGLPHLVEHLFLNSRERQKASRLVEFEKRGFMYNARTGKEFVNFYVVCKPGFELQALDLLVDCSQSTFISQPILDAEKSIIYTEIGLINPLDRLLDLAEKRLWRGNTLANSVLGTQQSINSITLNDVNSYIKSNFSNEKIIPVIISNKSLMLKDNDSQDNTYESRKVLTPLSSVAILSKDGYVVTSIALPPMGQLEQQALDYVAYVLAGGWTSILLRKLRHELNLVYWINHKIRFHFDSTTLHLIIRTHSQNKTIVEQQVREVIFNLNTYLCNFIDNTSDFVQTYQVKQLIKSTNPYENLIKVVGLLSLDRSVNKYSFSKLPSKRVIYKILSILSQAVQAS